MAIETDIATFISTNLSFTLGTDIFLHSLPRTVREGITVEFLRGHDTDDRLTPTQIGIILFYKQYTTGRTNQQSIINLLNNHRGLIGTGWSIQGDIISQRFGIDEIDRFLLGISFNVVEN
jgi:hypothetical protein